MLVTRNDCMGCYSSFEGKPGEAACLASGADIPLTATFCWVNLHKGQEERVIMQPLNLTYHRQSSGTRIKAYDPDFAWRSARDKRVSDRFGVRLDMSDAGPGVVETQIWPRSVGSGCDSGRHCDPDVGILRHILRDI